MSKSQFSSRWASRLALFVVIGASVFVFMAAGTHAAGFTFLTSMLGISDKTESAAASSSAPAGVSKTDRDSGRDRLNVFGNLADSSKGAKGTPRVPEGFDCADIPSLGINKQENLR